MEVHRERGESAGMGRVRYRGAAVEFREPRSNESCKSQNAQRFFVLCFCYKALILMC